MIVPFFLDLSPRHHQLEQQQQQGGSSPLHQSRGGTATPTSGSGTPLTPQQTHNLKLAASSRDRSSSTELCAPSEEDDETENATDIEEIPRDQVPIIKDPAAGSTPPPPPPSSINAHLAQPSADQEKKHKEFIEKLMRDFDENPRDANEKEQGEEGSEEDESRSCYIPERRISRANSEKAIQIIKENSEILDKILRKKGERMGVPDFPIHGSPAHQPGGVDSSAPPSMMSGSCSANNLPVQPPPSVCGSSQSSNKSTISGSNHNHHKLVNPAAVGNGVTKPITFNPFPTRPVARRKRQEVGRKLGLYSSAS